MALDYSKLSESELQAIADGDYTKLSDATLQALSQETQTQTAPGAAQAQPPAPTAGDYAEAGALGAGGAAAGYGAYKYATKISPAVQGAKMIYNAIKSPEGMLNPRNIAQAANTLKSGLGTPAPAPAASAPVAPVAPQSMPAPAPQPAPKAAQPGLLDRTTQMVRELAASKVMQGVARAGAGIAAAVTPSNVGQNYPFPTSGPLRGSEINPATGRPWTQQELAAYRAQYGQ